MAVLPIITYKDNALRKEALKIKGDSTELQKLIDDMFDTMYNSSGVGLAAPQIGQNIRLFVLDTDAMTEEVEGAVNYGPMVFINPEIIEKGEEKTIMEEGCLSIPDVRDDITRPDRIRVRYLDRNFNEKTETFTGWPSRAIQHESDHLNGVLFIDYLSAFRKRIHKLQLKKIEEGVLQVSYPIVPK